MYGEWWPKKVNNLSMEVVNGLLPFPLPCKMKSLKVTKSFLVYYEIQCLKNRSVGRGHGTQIRLKEALTQIQNNIYKKVAPRNSFSKAYRHTQLKGQESKSWVFFEGPRRLRGSQKSEKFNFSKYTNKKVDHKFKSFAIN